MSADTNDKSADHKTAGCLGLLVALVGVIIAWAAWRYPVSPPPPPPHPSPPQELGTDLRPAVRGPERQVSPYGENASLVSKSSHTDPETIRRNQEIIHILEEPIAMSFPSDTPLEDVLKYIKQATWTGSYAGITVYIDELGFHEAERSLNSTVNLDMENVPLKTTLKIMLSQINLTYRIWNGVLVITSDPLPEDSIYK